MELPITISPKALEQVKYIMANKSIPEGYALRVGVKGAGCSGVSFMLGFDVQKTADDAYNYQGLKVLIEKKHTMYLIGMLLDFEDNENASGFVFLNPEALKEKQ
jgi:iron-sulfur cluster assembly protein